MPGLHVIRDKTTKEMVCMWGVAEEPETQKALERGTLHLPTAASDILLEDQEYVFFPALTHRSALAVAKNRFKEKYKQKNGENAKPKGMPGDPDEPALGRMYVHDDRTIDADEPVPNPTLADEILKARKAKNEAVDAPVSLAELADAERKLYAQKRL